MRHYSSSSSSFISFLSPLKATGADSSSSQREAKKSFAEKKLLLFVWEFRFTVAHRMSGGFLALQVKPVLKLF